MSAPIRREPRPAVRDVAAQSRSRGSYTPPCTHYPGCFGCKFIDLPYPRQLVAKQRLVSTALAGHPLLAHLKVPPVVSSPQRLRYRTRVKLVVRQAGSAILTGLYVPGTHRVVDISSCPVHPEAINRVLQYLKKKLSSLDIRPYDPATDQGDLRYLDFSYGSWRHEILLTLITRRRALSKAQNLARLLRQRFRFVTGVLQNTNEGTGNVIWGEEFRLLAGRDTLMERIGPLKLKYPAGAFAQVNPPVAAKIYAAIYRAAALTGAETALDLYCGVGPISLHLAAAAALVWGIDESRVAIAAAKQNARLNGFGNCRFFAADVAAKLHEARALPRLGFIVINPPRKGLRPDLLAPLCALNAPALAYVSCNPLTLARDLSRLAAAGYRTESVQPFDMFPQTPEVETLALLKRSA